MLREDIEYGKAGQCSLRMDAHVPEGIGPFPAVILVHGGGWVSGHRRRNLEPLFRPLEEAGFAWFTISYRLATHLTLFGVAVDDVAAAIRYVTQHAREYRIDASRIAVIGESAGAQLATMAVLRNGGARGVVAISPPADLISLAKTSRHIPEELRTMMEDTPCAEMLWTGLRELSPVFNVRAGAPPFLLIHGTRDQLVPYQQSLELHRRLRELGGSCELYPLEGAGHGLRWWEGNVRWIAYKRRMVDWLKATLDVAEQPALRTA
jgi:alpha-L-fucosidase 2